MNLGLEGSLVNKVLWADNGFRKEHEALESKKGEGLHERPLGRGRSELA